MQRKGDTHEMAKYRVSIIPEDIGGDGKPRYLEAGVASRAVRDAIARRSKVGVRIAKLDITFCDPENADYDGDEIHLVRIP